VKSGFLMIVPIYAKVSKGNNVSVAGCLGYDVLLD
jgi:hypothetical protein